MSFLFLRFFLFVVSLPSFLLTVYFSFLPDVLLSLYLFYLSAYLAFFSGFSFPFCYLFLCTLFFILFCSLSLLLPYFTCHISIFRLFCFLFSFPITFHFTSILLTTHSQILSAILFPEIRVRFPALQDFLSSGSGTGSTQPREYN
jgi:hypothetical protein